MKVTIDDGYVKYEFSIKDNDGRYLTNVSIAQVYELICEGLNVPQQKGIHKGKSDDYENTIEKIRKEIKHTRKYGNMIDE